MLTNLTQQCYLNDYNTLQAMKAIHVLVLRRMYPILRYLLQYLIVASSEGAVYSV